MTERRPCPGYWPRPMEHRACVGDGTTPSTPSGRIEPCNACREAARTLADHA